MKTTSVLVPILAGTGLVFVWSAIHGANISASLKDILAGRAPTTPATDAALTTLETATSATQGVSTAPTQGLGTAPAGNRANGQLQAAARGWTGEQWTALDRLWSQESGWNNLAVNASSGASGIAQFLDATWATVGGSKTSDPTLQIRYGLDYIARRYGTPAAAWAHEQAQGWY